MEKLIKVDKRGVLFSKIEIIITHFGIRKKVNRRRVMINIDFFFIFIQVSIARIKRNLCEETCSKLFELRQPFLKSKTYSLHDLSRRII